MNDMEQRFRGLLNIMLVQQESHAKELRRGVEPEMQVGSSRDEEGEEMINYLQSIMPVAYSSYLKRPHLTEMYNALMDGNDTFISWLESINTAGKSLKGHISWVKKKYSTQKL